MGKTFKSVYNVSYERLYLCIEQKEKPTNSDLIPHLYSV